MTKSQVLFDKKIKLSYSGSMVEFVPYPIRDFILKELPEHPRDISSLVRRSFGISRQSVNYHLKRLECEGLIRSEGKTKGKRYYLRSLSKKTIVCPIKPEYDEDSVWHEQIKKLLPEMPSNVNEICYYGFTEMFNNVLDHSEGTEVRVMVEFDKTSIHMTIIDNGVGIFDKISKALGLNDPHLAILELAKGKLTTDPDNHTGEGIFFTSRVCDEFTIASSNTRFLHFAPDNDWLIEDEKETIKGTCVMLTINLDTHRTLSEVFDKYATPDSYSFDKTHIPVKLYRYGDTNLVSRSQAKRLLSRFNEFQEVFLDFAEVTTIGRAFADQVFRVFRKKNPNIKIIWVNANLKVERIIKNALKGELSEQQPEDQLKFDLNPGSDTQSNN